MKQSIMFQLILKEKKRLFYNNKESCWPFLDFVGSYLWHTSMLKSRWNDNTWCGDRGDHGDAQQEISEPYYPSLSNSQVNS